MKEISDNPQFRKRLRLAILSEFPDVAELEIFVADAFGENLHAIAAGGNLEQMAFMLIRWAEAQGKLENLVAALRAESSTNPRVRELVATLPPEENDPEEKSLEEKLVVRRREERGQYFIEDLGNGVALEMARIPNGKFLMGSPANESERDESEGPQHEVTVPGFFLGCYPIMQAQWRAVAGLPRIRIDLDPDPSHFKGNRRPVEQVSWYEAVEFCDRLTAKTRRPYRLPSEAEWEYACRAGTATPFHFGETITPDLANYNGNFLYGRGPAGTYRRETTDVGGCSVANTFGLYDMHGNVWEWCADTWHEHYERAPADGSAWVNEAGSNVAIAASSNEKGSNQKILRGGSWRSNPWICRSAFRGSFAPDYRNLNLGLRVSCYFPERARI